MVTTTITNGVVHSSCEVGHRREMSGPVLNRKGRALSTIHEFCTALVVWLMGPRALSQMHGNNTEHGHDAKPTCAICPPVGSLHTHVNHALPSIKWDTVAWNDLHLRGLIQTMSELSHIDGCRVPWEIFLRVNSSPSNPDSIVLTGFIWRIIVDGMTSLQL